MWPTFLLLAALGPAGCTLTQQICAAQARLPTPLSREDLARLEALKEHITDEASAAFDPIPGVNFVDADETRGIVVVGIEDPTPAVCEAIHTRYGAFVEVVQQSGGQAC